MSGRVLAGLPGRVRHTQLWIWALVSAILLAAVAAGYLACPLLLLLLVAALGGLALLQWPLLGLVALPVAALLGRLEIGTGSEVTLNPATLLVPALLVVWILDMMRRGEVRLAPSRTNRPLLLFLAAGLVSLVIGIGTWDPAVPRSGNFIIVQLAQWAIFAFSAVVFWFTGNLAQDIIWLRRLVFVFLGLGGGIAIFYVVPALWPLAKPLVTAAIFRTPFWLSLTALSGGQLLFNRRLARGWRLFLFVVLGAVALYAFYWHRVTASNWVTVVAVAGVLTWLRWPRLRWPVILLLMALAASGILSTAVYEFAGGEEEWIESGGSRLVLIVRVVEETMRNPITGLGPAAYRPYAAVEPLFYYGAYWIAPQINSHNNYVDLFSQVGLLGLAIFAWFTVEVARLGLRLRARFAEGFAAGYVNGMLAAGAGALVLMLFADWILPFVYNIGFPGFQASVLVWLFLGGLVALEQVMNHELAQ